MFRRYHKHTRRALALAYSEAIEWNHGYLGCEHLLIGLLRTTGSTVASALNELKVDVTQTRALVADFVCPGTETVYKKRLPQIRRARRVITSYAHEEARKRHHKTIDTDHLLLALLRDGENVAAKLFERLGLTPDQIRKALGHVLRTMKVRNDHERNN